MSTGKYSPTVSFSYQRNQKWWRSATEHGQVDPDGYDSYGYAGEMGDGPDRAGNRELDYLQSYCEDTGRYILYDEVDREWARRLIEFKS